MKEAIKRFENYLRRRYAGRSTPKHYVSDLSLFAQLVGDKQPDLVSVQDVDHFVDQQVSQGLRPATINRRLAALHEQRVAMLSGVLRSTTAIQVNIQIMRVFVKMRNLITRYGELLAKVEALEENALDERDGWRFRLQWDISM